MTIGKFALLYAGAALVYMPLDAIWLGYVARDFYKTHLGAIMLDQPRWGAAILFYLLYGVGVAFFAMAPALGNGGWWKAAMLGALFGFFCYFTYDASNHATLREYPLILAVVDVIWGTVLTALAGGVGFLIATRLFGVSAE